MRADRTLRMIARLGYAVHEGRFNGLVLAEQLSDALVGDSRSARKTLMVAGMAAAVRTHLSGIDTQFVGTSFGRLHFAFWKSVLVLFLIHKTSFIQSDKPNRATCRLAL